MEDFKKGSKKNPNVVDIKEAKSQLKNRKKAPEISSEYNRARTSYNLGLSLFRKGKLPKAKECYLKAVEIDPSYALAWFDLAITCEDLGEKGEAIRNYKKAIESDPSYDAAFYNLAVLLESGNPLQAIHYYDEFIKLSDPKDKDREVAEKAITRLKQKITIK